MINDDDENGDSNGGVDGWDDEKRESSRIEGADCLQGLKARLHPVLPTTNCR